MDIRIKGKVNDKGQFASVLGALGAAGKTGCLVVTSGDVERRLYFEGGAIVAASSSATNESFGHVLVERAIIKEHNLTNAKELGTNQDSLLGSRLVEVGALSEDDVRNAVRLKVRDTLTEILADPDGQYEFTDETLPMKDKVPVFLDPGELMGGAKVLQEGQPSTTARSEQPSGMSIEPEPTLSGSTISEPTLSGPTISEPTLSEPTMSGGSSEPEPALIDRRDPEVSDRRDPEVPDRRDAASTTEPSEELPDRRDSATPDRRDASEPDRRDATVNKMLEMFADFHLGDEAPTSSDSPTSEPTLTGTESTLTGGTVYEESEPTIRETTPPYSESEPTLANAAPEPTAPESQPSTDSYARPATGSHARPATGSHARPATGSHARPATGSHARPATGSHARPTTGSHARPTTGSYTRPITGSHARPRTGVLDKPKSNTSIIGAAAAAAIVILGGSYWLFFGGDSAKEPAAGARLEVPKVETASPQPQAQPESPPKKIAEAPARKRRQEPPKQARQTQPTPPKREKTPAKIAPKPPPPTPAKKQEAPVKKQVAPPTAPTAPVKTAQNVAPNPPTTTGSTGSAPPPAAKTEPAATTKAAASEPANPPTAEAKAEPAEASGWDSAVFAPKKANVVTSKPAAPDVPVVKRGDLVEPSLDVIDPVLIKHPELKLPKEAKKKKIKEMVVRVRVLVDENGNVIEAKLDQAVGNGFDESAVQVARQARFIPSDPW